jgi:hypothetical protein
MSPPAPYDAARRADEPTSRRARIADQRAVTGRQMQILGTRFMRAAVVMAIAALSLTATALATAPTVKLGAYKGTTSQGVKATIDVQRADAGYYLIATPGIGLRIKEPCKGTTSSSVAYFHPTVAVRCLQPEHPRRVRGPGDRAHRRARQWHAFGHHPGDREGQRLQKRRRSHLRQAPIAARPGERDHGRRAYTGGRNRQRGRRGCDRDRARGTSPTSTTATASARDLPSAASTWGVARSLSPCSHSATTPHLNS